MNCPAASRAVSVLKQLELLVMKLGIFRLLPLTLNIFLNHRFITRFADGIDEIPVIFKFKRKLTSSSAKPLKINVWYIFSVGKFHCYGN